MKTTLWSGTYERDGVCIPARIIKVAHDDCIVEFFVEEKWGGRASTKFDDTDAYSVMCLAYMEKIQEEQPR